MRSSNNETQTELHDLILITLVLYAAYSLSYKLKRYGFFYKP